MALTAERLKTYGGLARLLIRYGRSDLVRKAGLEELADEDALAADTPGADVAERFASDLESLGSTYIKIGQFLSTRADLLSQPFLDALSRLQDDVAPFSFAEVEAIVTSELGVRISKAFSRFEAEPLAAASLGQVHRAALRDGREVVVKVQRPGIRARIVEELEAIEEIASLAEQHTEKGRRHGYVAMVQELRKSLLRELDFRQEARNLATLRANLAGFERIVVPAAIDDYTTSLVLTTEYVRGEKVTDVGPLGRIDIDGDALADELWGAYLHQVFVDGFVHADPHPGNVLLTDDGRIALVDLGMVTRVSPGLQEKLLQLLLAISEGRGEEAATLASRIGERRDDFDAEGFRRQVSTLVVDNRDARVAHIQIGRVVLAITRIAADNGVRIPPELTLLGKTLLNLHEVGRALAPGFDPNAAVRRRAAELTQRRVRSSVANVSVFGTLLEAKDFMERLPGRANKILDAIANNELSLSVDAIDEKLLLEGFQKVANRITMGLVLAALIVGAAMLMRVETTWRILGYPGLAMLLFLAAAGGGFWLTLDILLADRRTRRAARSKVAK
jgi:predicted unusual protein kinase regulating ubiquinone biosynthesis (AarF/ABC1/UbiB family)